MWLASGMGGKGDEVGDMCVSWIINGLWVPRPTVWAPCWRAREAADGLRSIPRSLVWKMGWRRGLRKWGRSLLSR